MEKIIPVAVTLDRAENKVKKIGYTREKLLGQDTSGPVSTRDALVSIPGRRAHEDLFDTADRVAAWVAFRIGLIEDREEVEHTADEHLDFDGLSFIGRLEALTLKEPFDDEKPFTFISGKLTGEFPGKQPFSVTFEDLVFSNGKDGERSGELTALADFLEEVKLYTQGRKFMGFEHVQLLLFEQSGQYLSLGGGTGDLNL